MVQRGTTSSFVVTGNCVWASVQYVHADLRLHPANFCCDVNRPRDTCTLADLYALSRARLHSTGSEIDWNTIVYARVGSSSARSGEAGDRSFPFTRLM